MKKRILTLLSLAVCIVLTLTACAKKLDTAELRANFQDLPAEQKSLLEAACSDIDKGDYKDALMPLRKVSFGARLDPKQAKLINNAIAIVREKIAKGQ